MKNEDVETIQPKALSAAALEQRRAYLREWRKKNPEKLAEQRRRYWERKAAEAARGAARE